MSRTRSSLAGLALACAAVVASSTALAADTLVTKLPSGDYGPGIAKSWSPGDNGVVLEVGDAAKANEVAATLRERLASVTIAVAGSKLTLTGVPGAALLDQLSRLSLSGEGADPLAELASLGGGSHMAAPEGGGSIRASKPVASLRPRILRDHDPAERILAEIVEVVRGDFPVVTLKIKVKTAAKSGPMKAQLTKGKVVEGAVALSTEAGGVDFYELLTQRNIGAFYLEKGDKVSLHAVAAEDGSIEIDFVERAKK